MGCDLSRICSVSYTVDHAALQFQVVYGLRTSLMTYRSMFHVPCQPIYSEYFIKADHNDIDNGIQCASRRIDAAEPQQQRGILSKTNNFCRLWHHHIPQLLIGRPFHLGPLDVDRSGVEVVHGDVRLRPNGVRKRPSVLWELSRPKRPHVLRRHSRRHQRGQSDHMSGFMTAYHTRCVGASREPTSCENGHLAQKMTISNKTYKETPAYAL